MKSKSKWIIFGISVAFIVFNLLRADFSEYDGLSGSNLVPVIAVTLSSYLVKVIILSAIIIGIKKLVDWIRRK